MDKGLTEELIAPCGLNCGVCRYYLATIRGLYKSKKAGCTGCLPSNRACSIIKEGCYLLKENKIRFCFECGDFPCAKFDRLNRRYSTKYNTNLVNNLMEIKSKGLDKWLGEEEKKWKCANCGGVVSIHDLTCYDCGQKRIGKQDVNQEVL